MKTKRDAIREIEDLIGKVTARMAAEDDAEQRYLTEHCSPEAARAIASLSVPALHLLDVIPAEGDPDGATINVVGVAQATGVPKGTVSKTVRRLVGAGAVARRALPGNRKEVHLRLTPLGAEIRAAHHGLHEQMGATLRVFLARYTRADLDVVIRVLADLYRMPREGLRFRPDLLDGEP